MASLAHPYHARLFSQLPTPSEKRLINIWMLTMIHIWVGNCLNASRNQSLQHKDVESNSSSWRCWFEDGPLCADSASQTAINTHQSLCVLFSDLLWALITFYSLFLASMESNSHKKPLESAMPWHINENSWINLVLFWFKIDIRHFFHWTLYSSETMCIITSL